MKQMLFKALMVSGAVLVSAAMAMGQQPQQQSMPQQQQTNPGMQQQQQQQATMQQQQQQSPQMQQMEDRSFVQHAMQGSMGEVQLGQLAEQKSSSQDVKQFAEKMTQDHSQLDEQMKPIAQQLGVKTPEKISKKGREAGCEAARSIGFAVRRRLYQGYGEAAQGRPVGFSARGAGHAESAAQTSGGAVRTTD